MDARLRTQRAGRARRSGVVAAAALLASVVLAAPAHAAPQGKWACYGTALHIDGTQDPVIANPFGIPCAETSASQPATGEIRGNPGRAAATEPRARTSSKLSDPPVSTDKAVVHASVKDVSILSGAHVITASGLSSSATAACTDSGGFTLSGVSQVAEVAVNGVKQQVTGGPQQINLPLTGTLHLNTHVNKGFSFARFQRALWLETKEGDVIVAESAVAGIDAPCVDGPPAPPPPPPAPVFGCWGNAITAGGFQPFFAHRAVLNCTEQHQSAFDLSAVNGLVSVSGLHASTTTIPDPLPVRPSGGYPDGTTVLGRGGAGAVTIDLNGSTVKLDGVNAKASTRCASGNALHSSSSQVHGLVVNGQAVPDETGYRRISLGNGAGVVNLNWSEHTAGYAWRRALWVQTFLGQEIVIGEAATGVTSNPC